MLKRILTQILAVSVLVTFAARANAFHFDPSIAIQQALNSPIVTVKYDEARAKVIELRLDGQSVATRALSGTTRSGELQFHLDLSTLDEGKHELEVRLFAENGELLGTEKSTVTINSPTDSAVEIAFPKQGDQVLGLVEIKVGFKQEFTKPYVSFMIDGQWKAIRNYEPYTYIWDTEQISNGWHELQVWIVGNDNITIRSRKVRVFVNNPGGRTDRPVVPHVEPITAPVTTVVPSVPIAPLSALATGYSGRIGTRSAAVITPISLTGISTGARSLTPTGRRIATTTKPNVTTPKPPVKPTTTLPSITPGLTAPKPPVTPIRTTTPTIALTHGTRLPNTGVLNIVYNSQVVKFDVAPRVINGIAMTPFRHLYEKAGGTVKWAGDTKTVTASGVGQTITLRIGSNIALMGDRKLEMEYAAFIIGSRTIVPLSFIGDTLNVDIDVDPATGHVLIRARK